MHEIRLVGRGGTGVVTAGELLGQAAVDEGRYAQSIPTFGPERRGALSQSTLRLSQEEILLKCTTAQPDVLLIIDPTIWHHAPVTLGFREGGSLIFNTTEAAEEIRDALVDGRYRYRIGVESFEIFTVDATGIALETLGRPITNTAMMGALAGATRLLKMESIEGVLAERFGVNGEANIAAARLGHQRFRRLGG
jgi:2-oxoacid:acceptor oxidoreductase gamma subunit (pyruvate/2-ketoisovalerate family)